MLAWTHRSQALFYRSAIQGGVYRYAKIAVGMGGSGQLNY